MKLLFDFFPIFLFFIAYKAFDIYIATAVAIAASFVQCLVSWLWQRKLEPMHLVTFGIVAIFGGLTLYLQDEMFIKWKPTVINWLFGVAFLISQWIGEAPLIQRMLSTNIDLPDHIWRKLNAGWWTFFFIIGAINLFVVYTFDTPTWVNFKLFGMMGLTLLFVIIQSVFLSKYISPTSTKQ